MQLFSVVFPFSDPYPGTLNPGLGSLVIPDSNTDPDFGFFKPKIESNYY